MAWWRHQMETFSALLAICAGNSPVPGEFPTQRPVTRSFDVYFDLRPNKRLSKQSWGWWFETLSCSLWRHRNGGLFCGLWLWLGPEISQPPVTKFSCPRQLALFFATPHAAREPAWPRDAGWDNKESTGSRFNIESFFLCIGFPL